MLIAYGEDIFYCYILYTLPFIYVYLVYSTKWAQKCKLKMFYCCCLYYFFIKASIWTPLMFFLLLNFNSDINITNFAFFFFFKYLCLSISCIKMTLFFKVHFNSLWDWAFLLIRLDNLLFVIDYFIVFTIIDVRSMIDLSYYNVICVSYFLVFNLLLTSIFCAFFFLRGFFL